MNKEKKIEKDIKAEEGVLPEEAKGENSSKSEDTQEDYKDKYLRAHAELDNMRKRFKKEREEYVKFANEDLLSQILYAVDNFDRALEHMNGAQDVNNVIEGIKMIQKQFHMLLENNGVTRIEALGKDFDPKLHNAIEHVETDDDKDHKVVEVIQSGYILNGRLLRPASVKVGKKKD